MTKRILIGMTTMVLAINAMAAVTGGKSVRESITEQTEKVRKEAFAGAGSMSKVAEAQKSAALDKLISWVAKGEQASSLKIALNGLTGKERDAAADDLASIVAAKQIGEITTDKVEGASLVRAAEASAKTLTSARFVGVSKSSTLLSATELSDSTAAVKKLIEMPELILTRFSIKERDSYTAVQEKMNDMIEKGSVKSAEEALVTSIMEVMKVDKVKAMEMVKKLKDCV